MAQIPFLLLAAAPAVSLPALPVPAERVRAGYCVGPEGRLLRARTEAGRSRQPLMVSGAGGAAAPEGGLFCRRLAAQCDALGARGVVVNWPDDSGWLPLTAELDRTLARERRTLWVPEFFARAAPRARVLVSSQLSGGTLARRLREARARWGERTALAVECAPWRFPLPSPPGAEEPLEPERLRGLLARRPQVRFSEELCAQYFTCMEEDGPALVLFDDGFSVRRKLELAARLGIAEALLSWEEIAPFSARLFSGL